MEETSKGGRGPPWAVAPLEREREREREIECILRNYFEKINVLLKCNKNDGHFT
jgi:hypothetical protein